MMNLIKVLVPFVGLVAANNATNGTGGNGTATTTVAATTAAAAAATTAAANTTAAPANSTAAVTTTGSSNKTEAAKVVVDVPVTIAFKGVEPKEMADAFSTPGMGDIEVSARRLAITQANAKLLLVAAAKGFATAIGGASANKKVSVFAVDAASDGVKITFRVTMTGTEATAAKASALETKVKDTATFKKALGDAVSAEIAKEDKIKAYTAEIKKIDAPVTTLSGGVTKAPAAATTTAASSGAVSFVAPAGAMLMAMFALF